MSTDLCKSDITLKEEYFSNILYASDIILLFNPSILVW
jgi:hypothetical protein